MCGAVCLMLAGPLPAVAAADSGSGGTVVTDAVAAVRVVPRTIRSVEAVSVQSPVGTVPRLPYLVWVTYSDGTAEYRQVRWGNSALATEREQADAERYPVGREYGIGGFVVGDDTTPEGYPVEARVTVVAGTDDAPRWPVAGPLPLDCVSLDGDNRLTYNRDLAIRAILSWDVSQQLYNYRESDG